MKQMLAKQILLLVIFLSQSIIAKDIKERYRDLPSCEITPNGWAKEFLVRQVHGLTGHPEESGYPYNTKMWLESLDYHDRECPGGSDWWPYEQTAYYLDGALRCSYYLHDKKLYDRVISNFNHVIKNTNTDGRVYAPNVEDDRWPFVILFRGMFEEYRNTGNQDILNAMKKYYKVLIQSSSLQTNDSKNKDTFKSRDVLHVELMCDIYGETGDKWFLNQAVDLYEKEATRSKGKSCIFYNGMLNGVVPSGHAVTYHEFLKLPAVLYYYTGNEKYKKAIYSAYDMLQKYDMLCDGLSSGVEHIEGNSEIMAHELCNTIDFNWTSGWALQATGDGTFADLMEKDLYNAAFSSVLSDFKAHEYYSAPNMPIACNMSSFYNDKLNWGLWGKDRLAYRPGHDTECCSGNLHRMFTTYMNRSCLASENAVKVALYLPLSYNIANGNNYISFKEETNYPFDLSSKFTFFKDTNKKINFQLRIPTWAKKYKIRKNGKSLNFKQDKMHFVSIRSRFKKGDVLEIEFVTEPILEKTINNGGAINYGPLVFSYQIPSRKRIIISDSGHKSSKEFPSYEFYPLSPLDWGYALSGSLKSSDFQIERTSNAHYPWDIHKSPIKIKVKAKKLKNWQLRDCAYNPPFPSQLMFTGQTDTLELEPLGGTVLRISNFPLY